MLRHSGEADTAMVPAVDTDMNKDIAAAMAADKNGKGNPRGEQTAVPRRIRVKNRRKRYLELHPEYFGSRLELADPLLYDRLIRRFQSAAEREAEGRAKGYSGILEADLWRGEAKIEALRHPDPNASITYRRGTDGEILAEERDEVPTSKEEGSALWKGEMETRFVEGRDGEFDYGPVDDGNEYDDIVSEEREAEEEWFDSETPRWADSDTYPEQDIKSDEQHPLRGETGVQDF